MTLRELTIEVVRLELDPSQEGIVRECFKSAEEAIRKMPLGTFSDEMAKAGKLIGQVIAKRNA